MICLFNEFGKKVKSNEEFALILQKRIRIFYWLITAGGITAAIALCNELFWHIGENSWLNGVYTGVGSGLIFAAIISIIKNKKVLKDEALLKEERLRTQDERNRTISAKAMQSATFALFILSYIALLIGGFFSRTIFYCFWWIVIIFTFSYLIFRKYYSYKI
ncbi:MAG: hypothetical protein GX235_01040 [Clostridiales bacterium]|nr:hypothetical protein [Clostridiales bacterium]